jgi:hypothetical protein
MKKLLVAGAMLAVAVSACKKTGEGQYEVEKPVVGTVTDTVNTPSVDVHMDSTKVAVPKVEVNKDSMTIKTPDIDVKKPQ